MTQQLVLSSPTIDEHSVRWQDLGQPDINALEASSESIAGKESSPVGPLIGVHMTVHDKISTIAVQNWLVGLTETLNLCSTNGFSASD